MKTVTIKNLISAGKASIDAYTTGVRIDHDKLSDALIKLKKEIEEAEQQPKSSISKWITDRYDKMKG